MRKLRAYSAVLITAGVVLIFISTVLPQLKSEQTLVRKGPGVPLTDGISYWIDTFILPPIDEGSQFYVNLRTERPGNESVTVFPYANGQFIGSKPLVNWVFERDQSSFMVSTVVTVSSSYFVSIYSRMNNYTLTIRSTWSPYDSLRVYLYWGIAALPAGLLILYYDRIRERQERMFRDSVVSQRPAGVDQPV